MSAVAVIAGFRKKHGLGQSTPRGKTPLVVHSPPLHDVLRRHGVEPLLTR
jgi:hypothetical protein